MLSILVFLISIVYSLSWRNVKLQSFPRLRSSSTLYATSITNTNLKTRSVSSLLSPTLKTPQYIFVGGKGGVGKTTTSSSLAIACADAGLKTLVVSTDPAHSLGDALDYNLQSGEITPIPTEQSLWALEIDIEQSLAEFQRSIEGLDLAKLSQSSGIPMDILKSIGIDDLADLLKNPPAGIDEVLALTKIFSLTAPTSTSTSTSKGSGPKSIASWAFDRIIIDTAPTGHTLRLLTLPRFLLKFTKKLKSLRDRLQGTMKMFSAFLDPGSGQGGGGGGLTKGLEQVFSLLDRLEGLQLQMTEVQSLLRDQRQTLFLPVTIPTQMAFKETERLIQALQRQEMAVGSIIVNQVLPGTGMQTQVEQREDQGSSSSSKEDQDYLKILYQGQQRSLQQLKSYVAISSAAASSSSTTASSPSSIHVQEVPMISQEVTGIYGLRLFGQLAHSSGSQQVGKDLTIFGGKGGVGKTTSAASYAVSLADQGYDTLIVSTDPAHSLFDSLGLTAANMAKGSSAADSSSWTGVSTRGTGIVMGQPFQLETGGSIAAGGAAGGGGGGELWAMEIDPVQALADLRQTLQLNTGNAAGGEGGSLAEELASLLFDNQDGDAPPGIDEIVALAQVMAIYEKGYRHPRTGRMVRFQRIVLDTAPTGHTLRMLSLPSFLQRTIQRIRKLRDTWQSSMLGGLLSGMMGSGGGQAANAAAQQEDRLLVFQQRMQSLEKLLQDQKRSEFVIVTIATEVAVAETKRLLLALQSGEGGQPGQQGGQRAAAGQGGQPSLLVRRVIVNQLLSSRLVNAAAAGSSDADAAAVSKEVAEYLQKVKRRQETVLKQLENLSQQSEVGLTIVPYCQREVRSVYGLRFVSNYLMQDPVSSQV